MPNMQTAFAPTLTLTPTPFAPPMLSLSRPPPPLTRPSLAHLWYPIPVSLAGAAPLWGYRQHSKLKEVGYLGPMQHSVLSV